MLSHELRRDEWLRLSSGCCGLGTRRPARATTATAMPWLGLCVAAIVVQAACAAPIQQQVAAATAPAGLKVQRPVASTAARGRPVIGVAFGGGSAKGIAHVGVIRWLAEHRIPIDVASGTSMGGLIGGAFATGMDADELDRMLAAIDWDEMFGSSSFAYKNIRRKADARDYPSRLEFGVKRGIVSPAALNNGEQVDLLLSRITAPYAGLQDFDQLPTPFRAVAVDLVTASRGGARSRIAAARAPRHHVAAADLPAGRNGWPRAGGRRHAEQRAGERRPGDGRGSRHRGQRRRSLRSAGSQLHALRPGGFHAGCHDARVDQGGASHQRTSSSTCRWRRIRIARLAAWP